MSTEPPWGGYPQQSEGSYPPGYGPAAEYSSPPVQPVYPQPPPPPGYGQPTYPSQPLYPPSGYAQPAYPLQPLYPPPPAYPSQPYYPPHMYVAQPMYPGMPLGVPDQNGGLAIAALVLGILSIPFALFGLCDAPVFVLGIVFGALGLKSRERHSMAMVGLILGIVGAVLAIGYMIFSTVLQFVLLQALPTPGP